MNYKTLNKSILMRLRKLPSTMQKKYDFFVYWLCFKPLRRLCRSDPAFVYLLRLELDTHINRSGMSSEILESTEIFHESMTDHALKSRKDIK